MAVVYKAYDTTLERHVAVKVIRSDEFGSAALGRMLQRFKREAKALAWLSHPNIVKVIDYGDQEGVPYLVMEYLPGGTLKQLIRGQPMPWRDAARLLLPVCRALIHAHEANIIHRDIKPSNILLTQSGEPMLTDFGIAKILEGSETTAELTATGAAIGTPEYMAPEQGLEHAVDARVDVYALGVIFYEMVTGQTPYRADTPWAVLLKKSTEPLPSPKKFVPRLPDDVEYALIKALQKDPKHRFPTVGKFLAALERIAEGKQIPEESTTSGHILRRLFFPFAVLGGVGIMGALILATVFLGINYIRERQTPVTPPQTQSSPPASISTLPFETEPSSPSPSPIATVMQSARISPNDGMELIHVLAGEFIRGVSVEDLETLFRMCPICPLDSLLDAQPQAIIHLDAFWMDKTEVTNAQFAKFVDATGYRTTAETSNAYSYVQDLRLRDFVSVPDAEWRRPQGKNSNINNKGDHAVTQISWQDAAAYCEWAGRRLPTEAEWEKAARGADGRMFPWGNRPPQLNDLNFDFLHGAIVAVGSYPNGASPYGVLDMSGNVWEWVADYYDESYYNNTPGVNPSGPNTGEGRVLRGGSWASEYDPYLVFVTTYYRLWNYDYISSDVLGFRCAISE